MPVQLLEQDNSDDPRVISLEAYAFGRANFSLHYFYTDTDAEFNGDVVSCSWDQLNAAVQNYMTAAGVADEMEVAMRFVHCFTTDGSSLFSRVQICKMLPSGEEIDGMQVYNLDTTGAVWYVISNAEFGPTNDDSLRGQEYLEHFYYKDDPSADIMECLLEGPDKYVKNLVIPWGQELKQMYLDNGSPESAGINFAACSYTDEYPHSANVAWPHGMVVYLSTSDGTPMLNNEDYIHIFQNKGADMATVCPPHCNVYIKPNV